MLFVSVNEVIITALLLLYLIVYFSCSVLVCYLLLYHAISHGQAGNALLSLHNEHGSSHFLWSTLSA